jgi:diketogulonate reductase-like aldo/keto reductase
MPACLQITSKLWNTYHAKEHVRLACEKSLFDMGVEYFDLYLIHFPISQKFVPIETAYPPEWVFPGEGKIVLDPVPYQETWMAMEELVKAGLAKSIGTCNIMCLQLMDVLSYCTITPAVNQVEMHPYLVQKSLIDYCKSVGIHITAFSPLGSSSYIEIGMDGGKGTGALNEEVVKAVAAEVSRSPAQVVLRWGIQRGVSVIPKSSKAERIVENFSLFDFELSDSQV